MTRKYLPHGTYFEVHQYYVGWCEAHKISHIASYLGMSFVLGRDKREGRLRFFSSCLCCKQVHYLPSKMAWQVDIDTQVSRSVKLFTM